MRQKLIELQEKTDISTVVGKDFISFLSQMDISNRNNISKNLVELNITINQLDIIEKYRLPNSTTVEYKLFSSSHEPFTKIENIWNIKNTLTNYKECT